MESRREVRFQGRRWEQAMSTRERAWFRNSGGIEEGYTIHTVENVHRIGNFHSPISPANRRCRWKALNDVGVGHGERQALHAAR
jgi:hypothetical protein